MDIIVMMVLAGVVFGWYFPEHLRMLSPHAEKFTIGIFWNVAMMFVFGVLFYFLTLFIPA